VHCSQHIPEFQEIVRRHGLTPVQWMHREGLLGPDTLLGHAIFLDHHSLVQWWSRRDLDLLVETGTSVAHCPVVFSRYGQMMEDVGGYIRKGVNVAMTDVLDATDLPGEKPTFVSVPMTGALAQDDSNCNVMDVTIEDSYEATVTNEKGVMETKSTHDFKYSVHLVYYGDHLAGNYTYADTFSGIDANGAAISGQIDGVTGSYSGTLQTGDEFDTGF